MSFISGDNAYNRTLTKAFDLCCLSVLTTIFCIPVFTSGAALTSMYAVMMKLRKGIEGGIVSSFIKEFKLNFKGSVAGSLIYVAGMLLFSFDLVTWTQNEVSSRSIWYGATLVVLLFFLTVFDWYLCIRARFVESTTQALGNAVRFMLIYLPVNILMGAYTLVIFLLLSKFAFLLFFFPLVGFAVLCFPKAWFIGKKIDRYIEDKGLETVEPEDEDTLTAAKDEAYRDLTDIKREKYEMKPFDRISYFLYNHIGAIVFAVLFLGIVGGVSCSFFFNNKTCDFALAVVNSYADKSDMEMSDDLTSFFGLDGKKHYAYVDTGYQISYQWEDETVENTAADESFSEKFFLNISHGAMDAAIIPESYYEYCNSIEDIFYDIEYLFSKEEVAAMKPRLVKGSGDFAEYYRGIRVDDCEYLKKTGITFIDANKDDAYILVFPIGSGHKNNIKKFMETEIGILE